MLLMEENLVRKEIDDIQYLLDYLKTIRNKKHVARLETYLSALKKIRENMHKWKQGHGVFKGLAETALQEEAKAPNIDINKVYRIFKEFEKEKINILKDAR